MIEELLFSLAALAGAGMKRLLSTLAAALIYPPAGRGGQS